MADRAAAARLLSDAMDRFQRLTAETSRISEERLGLSSSLLATFEAITLGAVKVSDVAAATRQHVSSASRSVDQLVTEGYVTRVEDPADRRAVQLGITAMGEELAREVADLRASLTEQMMSSLTDAEATQFATLAIRMAEQALALFAGNAAD